MILAVTEARLAISLLASGQRFIGRERLCTCRSTRMIRCWRCGFMRRTRGEAGSEARAEPRPYWAVRTYLLQRLGKVPEALDAYDRAIGLAEDLAVREFLLQKREYLFFFLL
jgi:hypothetical protein